MSQERLRPLTEEVPLLFWLIMGQLVIELSEEKKSGKAKTAVQVQHVRLIFAKIY